MGKVNVIRKNSKSYEIFNYVRNKKACTVNDVVDGLGIPQNVVARYMQILLNQGLILQSDRRIQSPTRKCSRHRVIGITMNDIRRKEKEILSGISEEQFLKGMYKLVYKIITHSHEALTPYEILLEVQREKPDYDDLDWVGTVCRDLWKRNELKIRRSPFRIPVNCLTSVNARRGSYVYGIDDEQVKEKVLKLAPKKVRDAYNRIIGEAKVFASFYLKKLSGITISQDECDGKKPDSWNWLIQRFYKAAWIQYKSYKQMGYFWRNSMPGDMVERQIMEFHPKSVAYRLQTIELGRMSEKRALFVFTMYAKLFWKRDIPLPDGFPTFIPSWFNPKHIKRYTHVEITSNGRERKVLDSGVWKFDVNPLDVILLERRDPLLQSHPSGFALNMKYTTKSIGEDFLKNMKATLKEGFIYKYRKNKDTGKKVPVKVWIPEHGALKPVVLCKGTYGGLVWRRCSDYGAMIITLNKLREMENALKEQFDIEFVDSKKIDEMMEKVRAYEYYQQHAYALGKDAVQMVKESRYA